MFCTITMKLTVSLCTDIVCTAGHCITLSCAVLNCTELYSHTLYRFVMHCTVLYCTALYFIAICCTVLHCTPLFYNELAVYCIWLHCDDVCKLTVNHGLTIVSALMKSATFDGLGREPFLRRLHLAAEFVRKGIYLMYDAAQCALHGTEKASI